MKKETMPYINNKKLYRIVIIFLMLYLVSGCERTKREVNELVQISESTIGFTQSLIRSSSNEILGLNNTEFDISTLYGYWVIGEVAFRDITAVSKDGLRDKVYRPEDLVGSIIEYREEAIYFHGNAYSIEKYNYQCHYFDDLLKQINMLPYVHLNYMNLNNLNAEDGCVFIRTALVDRINLPETGINIIMISEDNALFFTRGVFFYGYRINLGEKDKLELPKSPDNPNPEYLYGKWTIKHILNELADGKETYIDCKLEYQKDFIVSNDAVLENPTYSYDVPLDIELFSKWYPSVQLMDTKSAFLFSQYIFFEGVYLDVLGMDLYYVDKEQIIIYYDDIFYLAVRE